MLPSEFRFPLLRWPQRLLAMLLGEAFLGFLAIIAVALTLFPMLFEVSPVVDAGIDTAQWVIIGWFAFEFLFAFASARAKWAFVRSPWRWLDLATILLPLATLLPKTSHALLSSPVLRLVRLTRLIVLGVRMSGVSMRHRRVAAESTTQDSSAKITLVAEAPGISPQPADWAELKSWLAQPDAAWFHVSNPSPDQLVEIGATLRLPTGFLAAHFQGTNYPHVATAREFTALFVWLPDMAKPGQVERHGALLLRWGDSLLSFARRPTSTIERISASAAEADAAIENVPFAQRMLLHVLGRVVEQNDKVIGAFEHELRTLEDVPIRDSSPAFFERTFRVKKELSATQSDLWRLKGLLGDLAAGRVLSDAPDAAREVWQRLATSTEYLYETVVNVRDEVLSVMELHLNIVSFDMRRVMRVLAVVSVLGLIPAVIGGLFGMNLVDNPWPFTLPQVAFTISFGMVLCLYFFFVKGWLR